MVSAFMPDVVVEIAFDSGYTTPAASRTWTDVSSYVELAEGIDIDVGRQDENSVADANSLTLTLDNTDGRFTALRSASPYYPNVKIGRPIRVSLLGNLVPNPSLEVNTTGYGASSTTLTRSTAWAAVGAASLEVKSDGTINDSYAHVDGDFGAMRLGMVAGNTYTVSATINTPTALTGSLNAWARKIVVFYNAGAGYVTAESSAGPTTGAGRVSVTVTLPAGTTEAFVRLYNGSPTLNEIVHWDAVMVQHGTTLNDYADGSYPGWAWSGTAHNSTSIIPRFTGFIGEWPVEWDGSDAYAMAKIKASSRLARLGLTAQLRSMIEQTILSRGPVRYYTFGDASGVTSAAEVSGEGGGPLAPAGSGAAVVFGNATGPPTDGLTAATFADGQHLTTALPATVPRALHLTVKVDALPASSATLAEIVVIGDKAVRLRVSSAGVLTASHDTDTITGPNINDGATHDVTFTLVNDGGDAELFVDGVSVGVHATLAVTANATALRVGSGFTGVLSHVAYFDADSQLIEGTAAAAMADSVDGFAGDTTNARLLRVLGWAGVSPAEVDAEVGVETMTYQLTSGQTATDVLHECESTEGGVLFDGADGNVKFHNRSHRYLATAAATLDMTSQHVGADYVPRLDRSALVNDVTVSNPTTDESARAVDGTSRAEYGVATTSASSVAESYAPLQEKAGWLLRSYAEPRMRCPSLTVDVVAHQGLTPSAQTLLGVTVGDLLAVTNAPTQSDTTSPTYFVEGYSESIGPERYEITYNLSPTYPTLDTFVLDSSTRGVLDTNLLAY